MVWLSVRNNLKLIENVIIIVSKKILNFLISVHYVVLIILFTSQKLTQDITKLI